MVSLKQVVADNLPAAKPELWADVGGVMWRRFSAWVNTQADPAWPTRPLIATIAPEMLMLEVIPGDVIGMPIARFGVYEFAVSTLVREYLKAGDVFVDVGANIGYYSVIAAAMVGPLGSVYAFEPSSAVRARLERNIALNGLRQVRVRSEAVAQTSGRVRLIESNDAKNDGLGYVDSTGGEVGTEVPAIRLEDVADLRDRLPALIKVDVEGGELNVFRGAAAILREADAPSILFESFQIDKDAPTLRDWGYIIFQPALRRGAVHLNPDLSAPRYRSWEAPNFLAVKSTRGRDFARDRALP